MRTDALKWLALLIVTATAIGGVYYEYQNTRACAYPITYAIGAVDPRFGTATSTLLFEAAATAAIWNKAAGKTVLVYDKGADLKISLVYDAREANAKFGSDIARQQADIDTERAALDALQAQFTAEQTAYNQAVKDSNVRGGASRSEFTALSTQRAVLDSLAETINSRIASFNASIAAFNAEVAKYNQTTGRTFEEGEYVRDSTGERITIFEFVSNTQLERVLAHELGHAIGLDHNSDSRSIMFAKNESGNLVPTASDLAALHATCGK